MIRFLLTVSFAFIFSSGLFAQGFVFGVKGGLTMATQNWDNSLQRDVAVKYHGIAFIESYSEEDQFSLFAQAGYHVKGSAIRNRNLRDNITGNVFRSPTREFLFYNTSLTLGAKQKFDLNGSTKWYWLLGIRGDYTIDTNLDEYTELILRTGVLTNLPLDNPNFIRNFNYGITAGGGLEFPFGEYVAGILEFTVNPDFSFQYEQPMISNVYNYYTGTSTGSIPERQIRNLTFEVTLGFRFLRKIEYID